MTRTWTNRRGQVDIGTPCAAYHGITKGINVLFCVMLVLTAGREAHSDILAYEGFDYADIGDNLLRKDGGFGFATPWIPGSGIADDSISLADGSLNSAALPALGNRVRYAGGGGWSGLVRDLHSTIAVNETGTVYLSFLMNPERDQSSSWGGVGFIGVQHGTAPWAGYANGQYIMRNFDESGNRLSPSPAILNDTALLVVRADFTPGQDIFTLYVDPILGNPEPSVGTVKTDVNMPGLGSIFIAGGPSQSFSVDEIRIGETYFDVMPVPDVLYVGGNSVVGIHNVISGERSNHVYQPVGPVAPGLTQEWFQARNPGNRADLDYVFDNEPTAVPPFNASHGATWWTGRQTPFGPLVRYPDEVTPPLSETRNDNFVVRATGEIFVPESGTYRFADGTGEYAYWAIDLDRNGIAGDSPDEVIIDDNESASVLRSGGGGWGEVAFEVEDGGEWLGVEFNMGKTSERRDAGIIYWDYNPEAAEGQRLNAAAGFPESAVDGIRGEDAAHAYIPDTHLRSAPFELVSADYTAKLTDLFPYQFELDGDTGEADQIVVENPDPDLLTTVLNVDGATLRLAARGDLAEGDTFDLITADKLIGVPTITPEKNTWSWTYNPDTGAVTVDEIFDFDGDGGLTTADLDLLCSESRSAVHPSDFDLTDDTLVNADDVSAFLQQAGSLPGDTDLSGEVDFADFLGFSANFGEEGSWSHGDFDGSGNVDFSDFLILSSNFGQSSESIVAAAVPEPSANVLLLLATGCLGRIRRTRVR